MGSCSSGTLRELTEIDFVPTADAPCTTCDERKLLVTKPSCVDIFEFMTSSFLLIVEWLGLAPSAW